MRKLKLLLAGLAMLVGGVSANAQASYNYAYKDGAVVAAGGDYFLYNLGAKRFLDNGMNWGSRATVDNSGLNITLETSDGKYAIKTFVHTNYGGGGSGDYLNNNGYTDSDYRLWTFTPVSVVGYTNVYTISDGTNYLVYQTNAEGDNPGCNITTLSGTNNDYWILVTKAQREAAKDYTFMLDNTCFNRPWEHKAWVLSVSSTGGGGNATPNQSGGNVDNRCAESFRNAFTYLQDATGTISDGRYKLYNQGFYRLDGGSGAAQISLNDETAPFKVLNGNGEGTGESMSGASTAFSAGQYVNSVEAFVNTGSLKVGVKNDNNMNWVIWGNFYLEYLGQCVMDYAVALPADGTMSADTWYYKDIALAADDYNATADELGDIICTDDGYSLITSAGNVDLTATDNSFAAKRYYFKSSSANNLKIQAASYSYSVSSATTDMTYIQKGKTVTVNFVVSSNEPDVELSYNYSGVEFAGEAISVTPTASGFTFEVPEVTANNTYTLTIPAGAIGYASGSTFNATQEITLKTPAIFDGVYYMYNTYTESYISRAGNYNTQAVLDEWGLAFNVSTDAENNTKLQYFDSQYWLGDDGWCYGDCTGGRVRTFNVTQVVGGYKFLNTNNSKYLAANSGAVVADAVEGGNLVGTSNIWALESTEAHKANYTANANTQAASAASNVTLLDELGTITTKAALETELASNYTATPIDITGAKAEKFNSYPGNGKDDGPVTYYSETVSDLVPGLYKLSVDAFQRAAGNDRVAAADGARGIIYLYAGDAKTQLKSVMEYGADDAYTLGDNPNFEYGGKNYPNSLASGYVALETGNYTNDVYFYVASAGDVEIGIKNPSRMGGNFSTWCVYDNWTLTRYDKKVGLIGLNGNWSVDRLMTRISGDVYSKVVENFPAKSGINYEFKIRDYGTWDSFQFPASGKGNKSFSVEEDGLYTLTFTANISTGAVTVETTRTADLTGVATFVNAADWTEVCAYAYNSDSDKNAEWPGLQINKVGTYQGYDVYAYLYETKHNYIIFNNNNNGAQSSEGEDFVDGKQYSYGTIQPYYSVTYTNPGSWSNVYAFTWTTKGGSDKNATWPGIAMTPTENGYVYGVHAENAPTKIIFNDNGSNQTDNLKFYDGLTYDFAAKGGTVAITISSAGYRTYASAATLNFAGSDITAYRAEKSEGNITFTEHEWVPAGTGLLLKAEPGTYNIPTVTSDDEDYAVSSELTGVVKPTLVEGAGIFVLMDGAEGVGFYKTTAAAFTVGANTAYLPASVAEGRLFIGLDIDGETTGISTVNSQELNANSYYNLNGQRIMAPSKGLYIMNGKKVVVK